MLSSDPKPDDYTPGGALARAVTELLDADRRGADTSLARQRIAHAAESTSAAAFDLENEQALDDAHRSLFGLYGVTLWGVAPLTPPTARSVEYARSVLEMGFRAQLARRRPHITPPQPSAPVSNWFILTMDSLTTTPGWKQFIREKCSLDALKSMVSHRSLFFLREPDPWVFAVPALTGEAKAGLIDLLLDEYGWGKFERMHSSIYAELMTALDLDPAIDHYLPETPWQYIATLNLQWMYALVPGFRRRLIGTILLTEAQSPEAMENYLAAWRRLGVDDPAVTTFYELHITADEDHRRVALEEVVEPTCAGDPHACAEVAKGMIDLHALEGDYLALLIGSPEHAFDVARQPA